MDPSSPRPSYEQLAAEVVELRALVVELREANQRLVERVAELERQLGQNPRNSSRPPSSEGYGKPAPRSRRSSLGRRRGGQPGDEGRTLRQVDVPDEVIVHAPAVCGGCGTSLGAAPVVSTEARQVFDVPPIKLWVAEHRVEHRHCAGCATVTMGQAPRGVGAPAQYGPGVRAVASYLVGAQHLPYERAAAVLGDLLAAPVSPGSVAAWVSEAAAGLTGFTAAVRDELAAAEVACFDETGLRVDGALAWVHSASTPDLTLFTCHSRRGAAAMDAAGVLPAFAGVAVHDGWRPYRRYDVIHGLCNAHHLRELAGVAETDGQAWAAAMARLLTEIHRRVQDAKGGGADRLAPTLLAAYTARYQRLIDAGRVTNPAPAGRRRRPPAVNLLDRLDVYRDDVLRFATDFRVPFENNLAERDIRMVKLRQKISGCLRTMTGAHGFCAIRSYLSTAGKQGEPAIAVLRQLHAGHAWLPTAGTC